MIDTKYSAKNFIKADRTEVNNLASNLQEDVQNILHTHSQKLLLTIVEELNEMGHNLDVYDEDAGEISFRDTANQINGECLLRIALDTIVSSGYKDTHDEC